MRRALTLILLGTALSGCGQEPATPDALAQPTPEAHTAPVASEAPGDTPPQPLAVEPIPLVEAPRPQAQPPIRQTRQTVDATDDVRLQATVSSSEATPQVRYAALRRLEELDSPRAVPAALTLLREPGGDAFLRNNVVAFLARSTDPRAEQAIANLDPRLRRLAETLRQQAQGGR